jgi:hypothetical protein
MKGIKNQSLKIAILLIAIGSMAFVYWYVFYKKFDSKNIPKNADGIVMVDLKNTRNHFIFSYLKNPSLWELNLGNSEDKKHFDLSNYGIITPDYLALFHIKNQPLKQWCFVAIIENESKFDKALNDADFLKMTNNQNFICYNSKKLNAQIIRHSNQILYCFNTLKDKKSYSQIAENLFINQHYLDSKTIEKTLATTNAVTIWIQKNNLLEEDAIINISLKEDEIVAEGKLNWKSKYTKKSSFTSNPNALLSLGFNFDMIRNQDIFKRNSVQINKMIGFDLDSILIHHPTKTELIFYKIIEKKDSAITYDYDDDFNSIKKVVVHTTREPSFYFTLQTDNSKKVYEYLKNKNAIDEHQVFVNFPLATTKTSIQNNSLILEANPPENKSSKSFTTKIGYLQMNLNQLQEKDWRFLIAKNKNLALLKPFETVEINLTQKDNSGYFQASIKTKEEKNLLEIMK